VKAMVRLIISLATLTAAVGLLIGQTPAAADARLVKLRAGIAELEALSASVPDRGAVLWSIARNMADAGDLRGALSRLKECIPLDEGFDPSVSRRFLPLHGEPEFDVLAERFLWAWFTSPVAEPYERDPGYEGRMLLYRELADFPTFGIADSARRISGAPEAKQ
jgi:hypothetical protein